MWVCVDTVVTGNPLYSLQSTAGLAEELGRSQGLSGVVASVWTYGVRIDKLPVILGIVLGIPVAVWLAPRRVLTPLVALVVLVGVFVAEGAVGASVIDRYLMGAASVGLIFCAVAIGGWSMLERGSKLRRAWMVAAAALVLYGAYAAATTLSLSSLRTTLAYHEEFHEGLVGALANPAVKAELKRCPLLSLPDNKLIPDARWILDSNGQHDIVARSEARADAEKGVARAREPHPRRQRRGLPARQRGVLRGDRRRRRRPARPGPARRLQTDLHESLLRGLWQLLSPRRRARRAGDRRVAGLELSRRWAWSGLAVVLLAGLGLRLWGVRQGLPYPYNTDEAQHFVPHAVEMFRRSTLNPHYFANPPAFTYLLHFLFRISYGSAEGAVRALELHPEGVYTLARVAVALLGTGSLWLLYATGARLFGRAVGLLAAAIEAVAFLPVFYAHLALNDVPTLFPLTLSLLGSAGVLRKGRRRDYLLAGVGLGLACASKYTAGIVLLPLLAAATARYLNVEAGARAYVVGRRAAIGLALAGLAALLAFLVANPYAVLDYGDFHSELVHQSTLSAEAQGKLGAPQGGRLALLPLDAHLGSRLGAGAGGARRDARGLAQGAMAGPDAGAGAAPVPAVDGPGGSLLRALAAADLPDPLPARGVLRVARGGAARDLAQAQARRRSPRCSSWRCWPRASSTASTPAWCSRAPIRAP